MKKIIILFCIFLIIFGISYSFSLRETAKSEFVLDTISHISVKGNKKEAVNNAFKRVREIENYMTSFSENSDLATGILHNDTAFVIEKGLYYGEVSGGLFDISIKPLTRLWNITGEGPKVPREDEIKNTIPFVDYRKVLVSDNMLILPEGMDIELGAIAKGYAADEACEVLKKAGIKDAVVDLGGNIVVIGKKTVGIKNPISKNQGDYFGTIEIQNSAVATSGGYERYFEKDGKKYHHIIDPSTGYPVKTDILSATVICERAIDADSWSTILFSSGLKKAEEYIREYNLNAVITDESKNVYIYGNVDFTIKENTGFVLFVEKN